jgi:hypothetical protein
MKARTSVFIIFIFIAAVFVLGTVSHAYSAQTTSGQGLTSQNQSGNADVQNERPNTGRPLQPVIIRHVGWSWLFISGLIGFLLGRFTHRTRPYGRDEDIRRNRAA